VLDHLDLASGTGRVTRLDLTAPRLTLPSATAARDLAALLESLRSRPTLQVRRIAVTDGVLALGGRGGVRLERLHLTARTPERHGDGAWVVRARAALDGGAAMDVEGVVARDLREFDVLARLQRLAVAPWRALAGVPAGWNGRLSFDGRIRLAAREGAPAITLAGEARLADMGGAGRALHDLNVSLGPPAGVAGGAHLRVSASTEGGDRLGVDRIVPAAAGGRAVAPLGLLLGVLEEAMGTGTAAGVPSAMTAPNPSR
jgi:hypothetical protein